MSKLSTAIELLLHNRAVFCDSIIKTFFTWLPDKPYLSLRYRCLMGHWIDWKNPKTFTEKLQWLKLYDYKPEYTQMVDKLAVKDYVAERIGKEYIIPTLAVWDRVEDIDWDSLPNQFVLKTTHGGGGGGVVICKDKSLFDKTKAIEKLSRSMHSNAGNTYREKPYLNVPRKIIAEKFMAPEKNPAPADLPDYKFFCFNGEPKYCQVIRDRNIKETIDFYDMEWNHQEFVGLNLGFDFCNGLTSVARPENLDEMIDICRKLSKSIQFVRVDLYVIDDRKYFGELTFYPAGGFGEFTPKDWNERLGALIDCRATAGGGKFLITNGEIKKLETEYEELKDYKFFCFNGEVKFFKVDFGRFIEHHANYYNLHGELLPFGETAFVPNPNHVEIMPSNLAEMISIAERLSKGFRFLRVDLYNIKGEIYFGELTFYPSSGLTRWTSDDADIMLGDYIRI